MLRQNFMHRSRVIIDVCKRHGVWFDADKLSCLLDWVHCGGVEAAQTEQNQIAVEASRLQATRGTNAGDTFVTPSIEQRGIMFWMDAVGMVARLFTR
jgi:Zn-finger nucleic acid-binding protein